MQIDLIPEGPYRGHLRPHRPIKMLDPKGAKFQIPPSQEKLKGSRQRAKPLLLCVPSYTSNLEITTPDILK